MNKSKYITNKEIEILNAIIEYIERLIRHLKRWNKWRKHCLNGRFHKFLVLIGLRHSPTFAFVLTDEEEQKIRNGMMSALKGD